MTEKPEWIKSFDRPLNTEIKHINGHWYLYERSSKYDPKTKKSIKISGRMIGKITEEGLIPRALRISNTSQLESLEYGASQYFYLCSEEMRKELKKAFPEEWKRIYTVALLMTIYGSRLKRVAMEYEESFLSLVYPKLAMSGPSIAALFNEVGKSRSKARQFLSGMLKQGRAILIDGHRILSASRGIEGAELGYDSKHRFKPQLNIIYAFSIGEGTGRPEWFKRYAGSITDTSAMADFLDESGIDIKEATVVADKGFASEVNMDAITRYGLNYLIALYRGNRFAKGNIPSNETGYDGFFSYNGRPIFYKNLDGGESNKAFLFYDGSLACSELADLVARTERLNNEKAKKKEAEDSRRENGKSKLADSEYEELRPIELKEMMQGHEELGTITLYSSRIDIDAKDAYLLYKQRQAIEVCFRTLDTELEGDSSYMQDEASFDGWLFFNHLSILLANDIIERLKQKGVNSTCSFEDVRSYLRQINATYIDDKWVPNLRRSKIGSFCDKIGFDPSVILLPLDSDT